MKRCFPDGIPEAPYANDGVTMLCTGKLDEIKEGKICVAFNGFVQCRNSRVVDSIGLSFVRSFLSTSELDNSVEDYNSSRVGVVVF